MGFLDKVKALKNAITGGGADVKVSCTKARLGDEFEISVTAKISDADLMIKRAYIQIEGREDVEVPYTLPKSNDINEESRSKTNTKKLARSNITTYDQEIEITDTQILSANQLYEWSMRTSLPKDGLPVYKGTHCTHYYRVKVSLDCTGNDPDSGWQHIEVL